MMFGIEWEFQVTTLIFRELYRYFILGFYSMMNVFKIMNSLKAKICPTFIQSWEGFQSPIPFMSKTPPSHLSQIKTWCGGPRYAMEGKIK